MSTNASILSRSQIAEEDYTTEPTRGKILEQMHRITASQHFRNSRRYPLLLSYIVEQAVAGQEESLKERVLGISVFERHADYDTNADPVVRVSAGEIRKRLAQYYQSTGHDSELRIDVPLGSYLPQFFWPEKTPVPTLQRGGDDHSLNNSSNAVLALESPSQAVEPLVVPSFSLRRSIIGGSMIVVVLIFAMLTGGVLWNSKKKPALTPGLALFWEPVLHSPTPTLLALGVHSFDRNGVDLSPNSHVSRPQPEQTLLSAMTQTDMVHLSDVTSYGALIEVLSSHRHPFRTQGAADTTLEQLRDGPFILIGGFNNPWTKRLSQQLRFRFVTLNSRTNVIQDSLHPEVIWTIDTSASSISNARDYGVVSRFLDPTTDQYVVFAAGIGRSGTEAATDFLVNEKALDAWISTVPVHSATNVQVVISTEIVEGKHGPPHVIAYSFW